MARLLDQGACNTIKEIAAKEKMDPSMSVICCA
jgi:hypothetical protein